MSKRKYNDDELILAIAKGDRSHAQIAEAFGLTESDMARLVRGEYRPELQPRIEATSKSFLSEAQRLGSRAARHAIGTLVKLTDDAAEGVSAETRRKAAVDLLKYAFSGPAAADTRIELPSGYPGLTNEDMELLTVMKGGPTE